MENARGFTHALAGEAGIERRRLQLLAGLQTIAEIEGIEPSCDAHLLHGGLLYRDAPTAAPTQRAKPPRPSRLCRWPRPVDAKPRLPLVRCSAAPVFADVLPVFERLGVELPLCSPV